MLFPNFVKKKNYNTVHIISFVDNSGSRYVTLNSEIPSKQNIDKFYLYVSIHFSLKKKYNYEIFKTNMSCFLPYLKDLGFLSPRTFPSKQNLNNNT